MDKSKYSLSSYTEEQVAEARDAIMVMYREHVAIKESDLQHGTNEWGYADHVDRAWKQRIIAEDKELIRAVIAGEMDHVFWCNRSLIEHLTGEQHALLP